MQNEQLIELTADIVAAHVTNNSVAAGDVANLVKTVHQALSGLGQEASQPAEASPKTPAVSIRASVKPDFITCLECGKKQKTLKRHLQTAHGLTADEYRREFGLDKSYPMVATNYAQHRSELAKNLGLGRKAKEVAGSKKTKAKG